MEVRFVARKNRNPKPIVNPHAKKKIPLGYITTLPAKQAFHKVEELRTQLRTASYVKQIKVEVVQCNDSGMYAVYNNSTYKK